MQKLPAVALTERWYHELLPVALLHPRNLPNVLRLRPRLAIGTTRTTSGSIDVLAVLVFHSDHFLRHSCLEVHL